jgi:hypothetical protein
MTGATTYYVEGFGTNGGKPTTIDLYAFVNGHWQHTNQGIINIFTWPGPQDCQAFQSRRGCSRSMAGSSRASLPFPVIQGTAYASPKSR